MIEQTEDGEFEDKTERDHITPESKVEDGDLGDDMGAWDEDPETRLEIFIRTTYENASQYELRNGVADSNREFQTGFPDGERMTETPVDDVEVGDDGGTMAGWTEDLDTRLEIFIRTTYENASQYELRNGVTDSARTFDAGFPEAEHTMGDPGGGVEGGDLGSDMPGWEEEGDELIETMIQGTFTNNSRFDLPPGVTTGALEFEDMAVTRHQQPDVEQIDAGEGVVLGRNVFAVELSGNVWAVDDPDDPDMDHSLDVGNAEIELFPEDLEDPDEEIVQTTSASDGIYAVGLPDFNRTFILRVSHPLLGEKGESIEVEESDASLDVLFEVGAGGVSGISVGSGVSLG